MQKLTLGELITIHEATEDEAKVQEVKARPKAAEEQGAAINQPSTGQ